MLKIYYNHIIVLYLKKLSKKAVETKEIYGTSNAKLTLLCPFTQRGLFGIGYGIKAFGKMYIFLYLFYSYLLSLSVLICKLGPTIVNSFTYAMIPFPDVINPLRMLLTSTLLKRRKEMILGLFLV